MFRLSSDTGQARYRRLGRQRYFCSRLMTAAAHPSLNVPGPRLEAVARWKRRAGRVRLARKVLPAAILAIVVGLGGWIGLQSLKPNLSALALINGDIRMDNPHFYGRDAK